MAQQDNTGILKFANDAPWMSWGKPIGDAKEFARGKSDGATAGAVKPLDTFIKAVSAGKKGGDPIQKLDNIEKRVKALSDGYSTILKSNKGISKDVISVREATLSNGKSIKAAMGMIAEINKKLSDLSDSVQAGFNDINTQLDMARQLQEKEDKKKKAAEKKDQESISRINVGNILSSLASMPVLRAGIILGGVIGARWMTELSKQAFGENFRAELGGTAQKAYRESVTGMSATDAELKDMIQAGPKAAQGLLQDAESEDPMTKMSAMRDVARYGRKNLERIAAGEKLTVDEMKKEITAGPGASERAQQKLQELRNGATAQRPVTGVGETGSSSEAMEFFMRKGWTPEQAAGIVGNLQAESGASLKTNAVGDSGLAYGIAQWRPDRQDIFKKVYGKDIRAAGFKEQLEFVDWELKNTEAAAGRSLKNTNSAEEAANVVNSQYERSADKSNQRAANATVLAKSWQEKSGGQATPAGAAPGAMPVINMTGGAAAPPPSPLNAPDTATATAPGEKTEKNVAVPGAPAALPPASAQPRDFSAPYKPSPGENAMPQNVKVGPGVNLSSVDRSLLNNFFAAAQEYGRPVNIESAVRDDKKQAELWVRGNILREPGIYMPAAPKTPQTITYNGQTYNVPGGGRGSAHAEGQALDVREAPQMAGVLQKYGLTIPFGGSDPVHVQKVGYTPVGGAGPIGGGAGPGAAVPGAVPGYGMGAAIPRQMPGSAAQTAPQGMASPDMRSGVQLPGMLGSLGRAGGMGPLAGVLSGMPTINQPNIPLPGGILGSIGGSILGSVTGMIGSKIGGLLGGVMGQGGIGGGTIGGGILGGTPGIMGGTMSSVMSPRPGVPGPIAQQDTGSSLLGPLIGIIGSLASGGTRGMMQNPNMGGLLGNIGSVISNAATRSPNPVFPTDQYQNNNLPSAMPSTNLLRELFDLNAMPGFNPAGYAFGR